MLAISATMTSAVTLIAGRQRYSISRNPSSDYPDRSNQVWFWVWGYMRTVAVMLALLVLIMPISGCFGDEPVQSPEPEGPFSTLGEIPETTWYHYSGGINALDPVAVSEALALGADGVGEPLYFTCFLVYKFTIHHIYIIHIYI